MTQYRIYKYELLRLESERITREILLPHGSVPISVEEQNNSIVLYVKFPLEVATNVRWDVMVLGTGHSFEDDGSWKFIGTVKMLNGKLMFHVFLSERK